jgi:hypothetical protein
MDEFMARIGFGCGRLRGGVEESHSRRLLDTALDCGIRYFDTAPSYGGGASERILGQGLRGLRNQVQLCTKVGLAGSTPTAAATLRALIFTTMRTILPDSALGKLKNARRVQTRTIPTERKYGNFDVNSTRSSVQQSLERLETEYLDCLMLHEPRVSDPTQEVAQLLGELVREGKAVRLGVGTYAQLDDLPAYGDVAQFAIGPAVFTSSGSRTLIGHGLLRGLDSEAAERCLISAGIFDTMPALRKYLSDPVGISALLLNAVLLGTGIGRILVSTNSPTRLRDFVSTAKNMFGETESGYGDDCRAKLHDAAHRYFLAKEANR